MSVKIRPLFLRCIADCRDVIDCILKSDFLNYTLYNFVKADKESGEAETQTALCTLTLLEGVMTVSPVYAVAKVFQLTPLLKEKLRRFQDARVHERLRKVEADVEKRQRTGPADTGRHGDGPRGRHLNADEDRAQGNFRELPLIPTQQVGRAGRLCLSLCLSVCISV